MLRVPNSTESATSVVIEHTNKPPSVAFRVAQVWRYRELLVNLTRKELKVRYKNSVLGFVWTLLNPLLYLAIFTVVFTGFLRNPVEAYGVYLLSGLLAWNLFATSLTSATASIVQNAPLVQKVWFPREILPLASVGAAFVNFCFQMVVLVAGLVVFLRPPDWSLMVWVVPALIVVLLHATGIGLMLAASNVYLRDIQHFLELGLLALFWMTPIVYQYDFIGELVIDELGAGWERLVLLNPMIAVTTVFQGAFYNPLQIDDPEQLEYFDLFVRSDSWFATNLAITGVAGVIVLFLGLRTFGRLEHNLGEEL